MSRYGSFLRGYLESEGSLCGTPASEASQANHPPSLASKCRRPRPPDGELSTIRRQAAINALRGVDPDATPEEKFLILRMREACECLRNLFLGYVGNEKYKETAKHLVFEQRRGTRLEVQRFADVWQELDADFSGDVDAAEFIDHFANKKGGKDVDKFTCSRSLGYLMGGRRERLAEEFRSEAPRGRCTKDGVLQLMWPKAAQADLDWMNAIIFARNLESKRCSTPHMLPVAKRYELHENFRYLDKGRVGHLTYESLSESGLVDKEIAQTLKAQFDKDDNNKLDYVEFLEMLCPYGYLPHEKANHIFDPEGRSLSLVEFRDPATGDTFSGWLLDSDLDNLRKDGEMAKRLFVRQDARHDSGRRKEDTAASPAFQAALADQQASHTLPRLSDASPLEHDLLTELWKA